MLNDKGIRGDVLQERGRGSRLGSKDRSGAETQVIGGDVGEIKFRACVSSPPSRKFLPLKPGAPLVVEQPTSGAPEN